MPTQLLTPRRWLLIVAVLLLVNSQLPQRHATKAGVAPRAVATFVAAPLAAPLKGLSDSLRGGEAGHPDWGDESLAVLEAERRLQQVRALETALAEAQELIAMLTQSREMLQLEGVQLVPARVSGFSGDPVRPVLTIDRGTFSGVHDGAAVVSGFNLVGRVAKAYAGSADVELITAAGTKLQVRILPPRTDDVPRELVEQLELEEDGRWFEVQVEIDAAVEVGDLAHLIDERWPPAARGYVVGQVKRVAPDPANPHLFKELVIEPLPPLADLTRVTVLIPAGE